MSPFAIVLCLLLAVLLAGAVWPAGDSKGALYVASALVACLLVLTLVGVR